MQPVFLDANSWQRLSEDDELFGRWPAKRDVSSFWAFLKSISEPIHNRMNELVYGQNWLDATPILTRSIVFWLDAMARSDGIPIENVVS